MLNEFGVCNLSIVPLRAEGSDKAEILSELLFGECFEIIGRTEKWIKIRTAFEEYEGWIDAKQFQPVDEEEFNKLIKIPGVLGPALCHKVENSAGEAMYLLPGSCIPELSHGKFSIGGRTYHFSDEPQFSPQKDFNQYIHDYARFFLNAPYLWGGKSMFGMDCSGLTQLVFKMLGIQLKRDAWQQAEQGETVNFLQEARAGDLAFFDNEEGRIVHVGIMLDNSTIIHASGRVKIDPIDNQGIYSMDLGRHTHKLRIIKRFNCPQTSIE